MIIIIYKTLFVRFSVHKKTKLYTDTDTQSLGRGYIIYYIVTIVIYIGRHAVFVLKNSVVFS